MQRAFGTSEATKMKHNVVPVAKRVADYTKIYAGEKQNFKLRRGDMLHVPIVEVDMRIFQATLLK